MACSSEERERLAHRRRGQGRVSPLSVPILSALPQADTGAVRVLLRTLAGMEDFARVTAHWTRRPTHPSLTNDIVKHCCLHCLTDTSTVVMDSEWHAFCECPGTASARNIFCSNTNLEISCSSPCSIQDLCNLVKKVAGDPRLSGKLARFAYDIRSIRRHLFRRLSTDGPAGRTLVAARVAAVQS